MRASIHQRLFAVLGLFVLVITGLWAGLSLMLAYIVEDEIVDRVLATQIALVQEAYLATGDIPQPVLPQVALYAELAAVPQGLREYIQPAVGGEIFTPDETHYHYRWLQLPGSAPLVMVAEVSPWLVVSRISTPLLILLLMGFLVALLFSLVAVFYISRLTTRPLRELTAAIAQVPRPSPLPHVQQGDEVGVLAAAIDQALARETSFTHDVSHELRTPLTSLRNAIALLPEEAAGGEQREQLRAASITMENLLTALLALARAESALATDLPLRSMIESQLVQRSDQLEQLSFDIELQVPDGLRVSGNEQLANLVLGNLVDNALHYAEPRQLVIRAEDSALVFENPVGSGDCPAHPASLGHGLSLVRRLAVAQGWQFTSGRQSDRFCARLSYEK